MNIPSTCASDFTSDKKISIKNISGGRLFRTSFVEYVNNWLAEDYNRCGYYQNQEEINIDIEKNNSLAHSAIRRNGAGTGGQFTIAEFARSIVALRANNSNVITFLQTMLPKTLQSLKMVAPQNRRRNFINATQNQLATALSIIPGQQGAKREVIYILKDLENVDINLLNSQNPLEVPLLQNMYSNALNTIRREQANISNQKQNLLSLVDIVRSSVNVIEKAANSYLKTDYVLTAERYAENIRKIIASITALQANNKIPDAIQNLLSNLSS